MAAGLRKELRRAYEVALVPGDVTINPEEVDLSWRIGEHKFSTPVMAAAMDAVVDPGFAILLGRLGGLAVLNLEGLQTRYESISTGTQQLSIGEWRPPILGCHGTCVRVGINGSLQQILFGPTSRTDGTQNLMGALRTTMGVCGTRDIKEMQRAEMVVAPAIVTEEGKTWQLTGSK